MHEAAVNGMTDMVRLLIDTHKADVNVITAMVRPSWYVAAEERRC